MKKLTLLLLSFLLVSCGTKQEFKNSTLTSGFDTLISVSLYDKNQEHFDSEWQKIKDSFWYYNALFDKYNDYNINNIKTINDNAGIKPVEVDEELIQMLLLSKKYSDLSNNQFDVTLGPVLSLWHDVREDAEFGNEITLPTEKQLQQARACTGWDKVEIDDEKNTVYLNQSCASLDVGAVAKGYATEKVAQMLIEDGYVNGFVNAGGNIRLLGSKLDGKSYRTGILSPIPNNSGHALAFLDLSNEISVVTSGDYQRYFMYNDEIMHHIIDPDTLYPARHAKSITILTKDSGLADILSTTLYTMTYQQGKELVEKLQETIDVEVVWIYDKLDEIENENYKEKEGFYLLSTPKISEELQ